MRRKLLPLRSTPSNLAPDPHGAVIACSAPPSSGSSSPARAVGAGGRCVNGSRSRRRCWIRTPGRSTPASPRYGNASVGSPVLGHAGLGGQLPGRRIDPRATDQASRPMDWRQFRREMGRRPGAPTRCRSARAGSGTDPPRHMGLDMLDDPGGCGLPRCGGRDGGWRSGRA